jgi:hypothetical protein
MKKSNLALFGLGIFMILAGMASAEGFGGNGKPGFGNPFKEERREFKTEMSQERKEFWEERKAARQEFMDKMKTEREAFMEELKNKKEDWKNSNPEDKAKFRGNAQKMIGQRFDMAIRNLERIQGRVAEVIADLDAGGEDTTTAEEALEDSKEKLGDAKEKIEDIKDLIPDADEKVTPEVFEQIKLLAREAKDLLKESRENLVLAIQAVKELKGEDNDADGADENED